MARPWRGLTLLGVALAALALAACGNDKSSDGSASSTPESVAGKSGTTGTSGATGASSLPSTSGSGKKHDSGGATAPAGSVGGGDSPASSAPSTNAGSQKDSSTNSAPKPKKKPQFAPGAFLGQGKQLYKQSKEVCNYLTLDGLAREYNVTPKTPEAVAHRYAKAYPKRVRDSVYRGCKAGLTS
jgi:hypothetical protein